MSCWSPLEGPPSNPLGIYSLGKGLVVSQLGSLHNQPEGNQNEEERREKGCASCESMPPPSTAAVLPIPFLSCHLSTGAGHATINGKLQEPMVQQTQMKNGEGLLYYTKELPRS